MLKFSAFLRLIRPINSIMVGFAVLVGALISSKSVSLNSCLTLCMGFITGFTLSGSAMAVNDYYDREIDSINEPSRPIPSGAIKPNEALIISSISSVIGLTFSWITGVYSLIIAIFAWFFMILYSTAGKKMGLLGNMMVSTCISLPFIYGGVIIGGSVLSSSFLFALIAFLANSGREVTKGIVDIEGDRVKGIKTIAVSKGSKFAAYISAIFYLSAVLISFFPIYFNLVSTWYIPLVMITDVGLIYSSVSLILKPSRVNSKKVKTLVLFLMLTGLLGFLIGKLL